MSLGRKALSEKVLVLGIDGMDPRLTRRYVDEGIMPNTKKFIERGACREDLVLLGAQPTVTPPMWTTLATGAYPNTHGITCFLRHSKMDNLDTLEYNLDSRNCMAEQIWNVFAEAGKKTLVWHWPGSSWPPTSDSPNLSVIDGTTPSQINVGVATVEDTIMAVATDKTEDILFKSKIPSDGKAPCMITDLEHVDDKEEINCLNAVRAKKSVNIMLDYNDGEGVFSDKPYDISLSPIKDATGWVNTPAGAKEFTILLSGGLNKRSALILKNAQGVYDQVAIYKSKKAAAPIITLEKNVLTEYIDESIKGDERFQSNRFIRLLDLEEDASKVRIWFGPAMDINNDTMFHPTSLYKKIIDNAGYVPCSVILGGSDKKIMKECMLDSWSYLLNWTADALNYLITNEEYEAIFTQVHNVDAQGHILVKHLKGGKRETTPEEYQEVFKEVYMQTDEYIGKFLPLLDEGWSIIIVSDHAQVCPEEGALLFGDMSGVNVTLMRELGFTAVKEDENGNPLKEIDWAHTKAIAQRGNHIYLNLKGRDPEGIVEPSDQFEVEEEIMTALYGYKHPHTGKRVFSLALRNRDAVLLGMGGPECGDILCWTAEGYNYDHCDSLSTIYGYGGTSVSPIALFAGKGFKEGVYTNRVIRQVDIAPTVATLCGVRMPRECEGAPVYQIFAEEF